MVTINLRHSTAKGVIPDGEYIKLEKDTVSMIVDLAIDVVNEWRDGEDLNDKLVVLEELLAENDYRFEVGI